MTIGVWIQSRFNLLGYPYSKDIEAELFKDSSPNEAFSAETQEKVEVALFNLIPYLLTMPKSVSEAGFSITRQSLTDLYKALLAKWGAKYGLEDTYGILNTIEDVTDVW